MAIHNIRRQQHYTARSRTKRLKDILLFPIRSMAAVIKQLGSLWRRLWTRSRDLFISFPIKQKLTIIIGLIVITVILVLSFIFEQTEKQLLQSKLEEICNLSVQYLSYVIREDLLLGKYDRIKEAVLRLKNQNIKGLDYAWVVNRQGQCIAHTNLKLTQSDQPFLPEEEKNWLLSLKTPTVKELATHYEYYHPIFEVKKSGGEQSYIYIGITGIGFSKDLLLDPIREAQKIVYTIALLVTLLSVLGIYFLTQRMVQQIRALSEGARQIGQGNLDIKISVNTRDELGQLATEFNNMTMHLKEKLQMQKFVSQMTRQMIKKNLASNGRPMKSEQCEIAVLFSDVRDFSRFSQRNKPEIVVDVINIYLDLQANIIEENFGIVDKFMGDQIMGVFEGANKHINMLNAAVAIQKEISKLNFKRRMSNLEILTVGVGINIGHAVLGNIGSKERMDYTVVGDVVNLAARFCDIAKAGQIITSTKSYAMFKLPYPMVKLGAIKIKGRDEPLEICNIDYHRDYIM